MNYLLAGLPLLKAAPANGEAEGGNLWVTLVMLVLMLAVLHYFTMVRPQRKKRESYMKKFLIVMSLGLYITMSVFLYKGYDKITNYKNSDDETENAYVGGDAYNYIINANYASGYFILAVGAGIIGTMLALEASRREHGPVEEKEQSLWG